MKDSDDVSGPRRETSVKLKTDYDCSIYVIAFKVYHHHSSRRVGGHSSIRNFIVRAHIVYLYNAATSD